MHLIVVFIKSFLIVSLYDSNIMRDNGLGIGIRSWTPSKIHWFFSFYIEFFKSLVDKEVNIGQKALVKND